MKPRSVSVLAVLSLCWLWRIPGDDHQQFHAHSGPDDAPTFTLGAIADAHTGSRSVPSEFPPALSGDCLSSRANPNQPLLYLAR
jgi:hypothetical protein